MSIEDEILECFEEDQQRGCIPRGRNTLSQAAPVVVLKPERLPNKSTNHLCPRCGEDEMQAHDAAWGMCPRCGYTCCLDDLERLATRSANSVLNREIHECLAEDRRRGSRGGSGDKGPKKEDKLGSRSLRQVVWEDEALKSVKEESLEPKGRIRTIRGLPEGITGEQVREAVKRRLGDDASCHG